MPVREFRFLSAIPGFAAPFSSPKGSGSPGGLTSPLGLGVSPPGMPTPFSPTRGSRRWRLDAAGRNRRLSATMPFGRPRNALNKSHAARQQAAFPG